MLSTPITTMAQRILASMSLTTLPIRSLRQWTKVLQDSNVNEGRRTSRQNPRGRHRGRLRKTPSPPGPPPQRAQTRSGVPILARRLSRRHMDHKSPRPLPTAPAHGHLAAVHPYLLKPLPIRLRVLGLPPRILRQQRSLLQWQHWSLWRRTRLQATLYAPNRSSS